MARGGRHAHRPRHRPRAAAHRAPASPWGWARAVGVLGLGGALALSANLLLGEPPATERAPVAAALGVPAVNPDLPGTPASAAPGSAVPGVVPLTDAGQLLADDVFACLPQQLREGFAADPSGEAGRECAADLVAALPRTDLEREEPELLYQLITREQPIEPLRYAPDDLVDVQGGPYQLRAEAAEQLELLLAEAEEQGYPWLVVSSGFRAYEVQDGTHQDWVNRVGPDRAAEVSAVAGHSEHQLGLAVDLGGECGLYDCFGHSEDGAWVARNAHRWGFIIRYPEGGQEVTGYDWEPWHLRYVGPRAAWLMQLTGETYWEHVQPELVDEG